MHLLLVMLDGRLRHGADLPLIQGGVIRRQDGRGGPHDGTQAVVHGLGLVVALQALLEHRAGDRLVGGVHIRGDRHLGVLVQQVRVVVGGRADDGAGLPGLVEVDFGVRGGEGGRGGADYGAVGSHGGRWGEW